MALVPDMSLGAYASIFQDLDDKTVCLLDGNFSADDLRKVLAVLDPETAQLQARVAELEAALREYRSYAYHRDAGNTLSQMRHFEKFESELERLLP